MLHDIAPIIMKDASVNNVPGLYVILKGSSRDYWILLQRLLFICH
jgi:hypothetical protein